MENNITDITRRTWLFVDIEPGGVNLQKHPITEVAAIAVEAGSWQELDVFETKVQFRFSDADPRALGMNKYVPSIWERYALPQEIAAEKFAEFCRRHATVEKKSRRGKYYKVAQLAGHNADKFDGPFLHQWYRRHRIFFPASMRILCTKQLAMWFFEMNQGLTPPKDYKLTTLCDYFRLSCRPDHTALNDIRATVELARCISKIQLQSIDSKAA